MINFLSLDFMKIKCPCSSKDFIKKMNRQATNLGEYIHKTYINKWFLFTIYKEMLQKPTIKGWTTHFLNRYDNWTDVSQRKYIVISEQYIMVTEKCKLNPKWNTPSHPQKWLKSKRLQKTNVHKSVEHFSMSTEWSKMGQLLWRAVWQFLRELNASTQQFLS